MQNQTIVKTRELDDFCEKRKNGTYDIATRRQERRPDDEEKIKSVSGQIARRNAVRRHVTVTRAFQLIRNKRCQRQTDGNRWPGTNVIYRQARGNPVGCCLNDRPNVIATHVLCVYPAMGNL